MGGRDRLHRALAAHLPPAQPTPEHATAAQETTTTADDALAQVEVFLPGPAQGDPDPPGLFGDDTTDTNHQVGGIATLGARLAEATNTTAALTHPDTPRSLPGVRQPWFLPQVRTRKVRQAMPLASIITIQVEALGRQFADDNAPTLTRKALDAHRDDTGQVVVSITDATADASVPAAQMRLPLGDIAQDLTARLVRSNAVTQTPPRPPPPPASQPRSSPEPG